VWTPDLTLRGSLGFALLIAALHGLVVVALLQLAGGWMLLIPLALASAAYQVLLVGVRRLPGSVQRVWLTPQGWCLQSRNGRQHGPYALDGATRLDTRFVRLSLVKPGGWYRRHLILTPAMLDHDSFRRLQVFLRWAPEKSRSP
jgi:hypothetical protein